MSKESFLKKMAARLAQLDEKLKSFQADIGAAADQAKGRYSEIYRQLQSERDSLQLQMNTLKDSGAEAWGEVRSGVQRSYKELNRALKSALGKFRRGEEAESTAPPPP